MDHIPKMELGGNTFKRKLSHYTQEGCEKIRIEACDSDSVEKVIANSLPSEEYDVKLL